jgi:hypothetical protein
LTVMVEASLCSASFIVLTGLVVYVGYEVRNIVGSGSSSNKWRAAIAMVRHQTVHHVRNQVRPDGTVDSFRWVDGGNARCFVVFQLLARQLDKQQRQQLKGIDVCGSCVPGTNWQVSGCDSTLNRSYQIWIRKKGC